MPMRRSARRSPQFETNRQSPPTREEQEDLLSTGDFQYSNMMQRNIISRAADRANHRAAIARGRGGRGRGGRGSIRLAHSRSDAARLARHGRNRSNRNRSNERIESNWAARAGYFNANRIGDANLPNRHRQRNEKNIKAEEINKYFSTRVLGNRSKYPSLYTKRTNGKWVLKNNIVLGTTNITTKNLTRNKKVNDSIFTFNMMANNAYIVKNQTGNTTNVLNKNSWKNMIKEKLMNKLAPTTITRGELKPNSIIRLGDLTFFWNDINALTAEKRLKKRKRNNLRNK